MFRYSRMRYALVASIVCLAAMASPSRADDVTPALTEAAKYLEKGVPAKAIEVVNRTLKSGQIPAEQASKALLLRARAHEAMDKYAYALADYNQALWMKGLAAGEKTEAETGRSRIMAKLGVGDADVPAPKPVKTAQAQVEPRTVPQSKGASWDTDVQTTASEERTGGTGGIGGFFGGIFGSSSSAPEKVEQPAEIQTSTRPPVQRVAVEPQRTAAIPQPRNVVTARVRPEPQPEPEQRIGQTKASLSAGSGEVSGEFAIQIAALHSEDRAIYEVNRVEKRFSDLLGGRTPSITVRETTDGNTLYKVIIEPYQRGEGVATCEVLKTKGLNCMLISR